MLRNRYRWLWKNIITLLCGERWITSLRKNFLRMPSGFFEWLDKYASSMYASFTSSISPIIFRTDSSERVCLINSEAAFTRSCQVYTAYESLLRKIWIVNYNDFLLRAFSKSQYYTPSGWNTHFIFVTVHRRILLIFVFRVIILYGEYDGQGMMWMITSTLLWD